MRKSALHRLLQQGYRAKWRHIRVRLCQSSIGIGLVTLTALAHAQMTPTTAQQQTQPVIPSTESRRQIAPDPLVGVVINRTITVLGKEFYRYFSATWRDLDLSERYTVTVYERPTAIRGSEMWVQFGNHRVYHSFLSPSRSAAREIAKAAVETVYNNIVELEVQQLLFRDDDLAPEEI